MTRTWRVTAVAAIALLHSAPVATADGPPPVDELRLPAARPPAPTHPTVRFGDCVAPPPTTTSAAGQLTGLDLPAVWALTRGAGQTVAVIDTGTARHRRLPHLIPGGDYVSTEDGTDDCDGHGTVVAGIIGASADVADPGGFTGIAPDVSLLAIRQSSNKFRAVDDPGGSGVGDVETLAAAVRTAADLGATVINISTVACLPADAALDDRSLGAALSYAVEVKNAVVVTAAGNIGGPGQCKDPNPRDVGGAGDVRTVASPAWYDEYVLTVGSVGTDGSPSEFSLAGPWVDVAATGEGVVSLAATGDGLTEVSPSGAALAGTSYAVPVVSAVAALVRSRFPAMTAHQVMQRITDTARPPSAGWDPTVGHGIVDALAAVSGAGARPAVRPGSPPAAAVVAEPPTSPQQGTKAVRGALLCLALTGGVAVVSAVIARWRRRG